jgi:hypothetical protein
MLCNVMTAVPWLRSLVTGLSPRRTGFAPGSVQVGFVVDTVALGQVFIHVRFQVLTAASMMFRVVFWDILPCKIIVDRRFRGAYCLHHQG